MARSSYKQPGDLSGLYVASMPTRSLVSEAGEAQCLGSGTLFCFQAAAWCLQLTESGLLISAGSSSDPILAAKAAGKNWPCRSRFMAAQTEPAPAAASRGRGGMREPICHISQEGVTHAGVGPWGDTLSSCRAGGVGGIDTEKPAPLSVNTERLRRTSLIYESRSQSKSPAGSPACVKSESRSGSRSPSRASKHSESHSQSRSKSRSRSRRHSHRRYTRSRSHSHRRRSRSRSYTPEYRRRRSRSHSPMSNRRRHTGSRVCSANPDPNTCLGVFGLSLYTTERDLREVFSRYGPLSGVNVVYDQRTGRSRGFAFVYFERIDDSKE
ncbi:hypothetical protein E2320_022556, partial [Naja naja]